MSLPYCKVRFCRFNSTHVTKGHKCGKCGKYGHGDVECGSRYYTELLKKYYNDILPLDMHCTVLQCNNKMYHNKDAHHCSKCNKREPHIYDDCKINLEENTSSNTVYNVKCPLCRQENTLINPRKILGLNDECCICYENKVEILFPICYHICICFTCLGKYEQ